MAQRPPSLADRAEALAAAGRAGEALRMLEGAGENPEALLVLANWRLSGHVIRRDLAASRDLFRRAAEAGHPLAQRIHAAFTANGTGGDSDWSGAVALLRRYGFAGAAEELDLIAAMQLAADGGPADLPEERRLSEQPSVSCFAALFGPSECDFLMRRAAPALMPSVVVDPASGRQFRNPIRTSDGMAFAFVDESPAIHALNRRLAAATRTHVAQGEPLQVLRYRPGQEYRPHSDALAGEANQRIATVLVYLNEGYEGGETLFLKTGLRFRGARGDALVFRNALDDGRADELAVHAGLPVTRGEKQIATRWIRARPFSLPPPRPLLDV